MQKGIAVYDLHWPSHNRTLWYNILDFIKEEQPDVFILGGDNLNFDAVDHWKMEKGQKRPLEGKRLLKEYNGFNQTILQELEEILPKHCRKIFLFGNHEDWVERYIDKHPEVEGMLEVRNNLPLKEWETYEYGEAAKTGKLLWIHGEVTSKHSASKTADIYGKNVAFGHGHTQQTFTNTTPYNQESHMACELPCACDLNPDYVKNKSKRWVNGFGVFYLADNGNFNLYPIIAPKGHFMFNNKEY